MTVRVPKRQSDSSRPVIIEMHKGTYGSYGYRAVRTATGENRSYQLYPGSTHDERDRSKLIGQSRDFMRNNSIYKGMIESAVDYIVGSGYEIQVTGGSDKQNREIEQLWRNWHSRPEIRNVLSGGEVAQMVMRELIVTGDFTAIKTDKGVLQLFEAEQLADPGGGNYKAGIKKDLYGAPMMFYLCPWKNYGVDTRNGRGVPVSDIVFVTNPERPSQLRGVPACQAVFPMLHRINDVCDSEAIAWQLLSRLAVSITREQGAQVGYTESKEDDTKDATELEGDLATRLTELDYALLFHGNPGEEVKGIERNIPGMNFSESLRTFLRLLGLPLGMPLELVLLDWTQSNYSQSRAVLEQAYQKFVRWQNKLRDFYYRPLFEWKFESWRAGMNMSAKKEINVSWITPDYPWIDQLKEAQAQATKVERGFTTHSAVCKSLGTDRDEIIVQREKEVRDAIAIAQRIEKDTGQAVPYQQFCGLKIESQKGQLASIVDSDREESSSQENENE